MTHGSLRRRASVSDIARAINRFDPDGSKGRRLLRSLEDPNNPNRPENNKNPLEIGRYDILVLQQLKDHTKRRAYRVLSVHRGWDHKIHLHLTSADSRMDVLTTHVTVESNGVNVEHEILSANYREGFPAIYVYETIERILIGPSERRKESR